jgi:hypothetical protein
MRPCLAFSCCFIQVLNPKQQTAAFQVRILKRAPQPGTYRVVVCYHALQTSLLRFVWEKLLAYGKAPMRGSNLPPRRSKTGRGCKTIGRGSGICTVTARERGRLCKGPRTHFWLQR